MPGIIVIVEKQVRVFHSHEEADQADAAYYKALTPQERMQIMFELIERRHPGWAQQGMLRLWQIRKLSDDL